MQIRELSIQDLPKIKIFADKVIGQNYFTTHELEECYQKSIFQGIMCSFVLVDHQDQVQGLRLAYAPGTWSQGKSSKLRPDLWKVPIQKVGYFQSLFLSENVRGQGWGPKLSDAAINCFKKLGALAVVTHAWKESPNNTSIRYLSKYRFKSVATHPNYWIDVDYECVLDGKPCRCTAEEMIKYL